MLIEIITNIGMTMVAFLRGMPNDERINRNIEMFKSTEWFQPIYQTNHEFFKEDENVRYIIGWTNVDKTLKSEKRTNRLRKKIEAVLQDK
ncbi:hypothetical protein BTR23_18980 [Alkalihalophilus pseudofirmus]|nr:hypothetical protein BTR23_18980 [Alkalihalophilus pseudofirmus]